MRLKEKRKVSAQFPVVWRIHRSDPLPMEQKKHRVPPGGLDVDRQQQHPTIGSKQDSQTPSPTGGTWPEIKKSSTDGSSST